MCKREIFRLVLLLATCSWLNLSGAGDTKTIYGVFWSGCEDVCQAIKDYISESGLDAELVVRNVERDRSRLPKMVMEARELGADLVVTWGTSATLGITGTLDDLEDQRFLHSIPVVFTVVSDPIRSRIIEDYARTGRPNVTGTRSRVPESLNVRIMRRIKPNLGRIGIIYNTAEKNSVLKVNEYRDLQSELDFELIALELDINSEGTADPASIPVRVREMADRGVDFIYLGSSAFLEDHMEAFTQSAVENGIPILSPYETLVRDASAYMSVAARDYDVGKLAGKQISRILVDGAVPGDLEVVSVDQYAYVINMSAAKQLDLYPPVEILQVAEIVE